jgi:dihydroxyacetone kinase
VEDPVDRALRNTLLNDPSLRLIVEEKGMCNIVQFWSSQPHESTVLFRQAPPNSKKVILLSGGGSGHEPAHSGFVGDGMLDVAVAGNIFASPSASQVSSALSAVDSSEGYVKIPACLSLFTEFPSVLMIVKNYTGDKLNFGLAAEKAKADGRRVNMVVVEDDVSIEGNELVGSRGLAGVAFVHKIAGAAAAKGFVSHLSFLS